MLELIPLATVHIGVSIALAAILILVHRRLQRADFLLYWAIYWLAIAGNVAISRLVSPLFAGGSAGQVLSAALSGSFTPFYPVLMICAALSLGGGLSKRTARVLLSGAGVLAGMICVYFCMRPSAPGTFSHLVMFRPFLASLGVALFTYRLAVLGKREAGNARPALVALSLLYLVHNLALGWNPRGYAPGGYGPWSAAAGILLQFGLTIVFTYSAIEHAGQATREARESDRRLRSLLETVGVAGLMLDRQGCVEFCNNWLAGALVQPANAIVGSPWFESYVPQSERSRVKQVFESGIKTGHWPVTDEYSIQAGGNNAVLVQWYHTSLRSNDGEIIGAASLGLDLTQQRLLEEEILQAQKMETLGQLASGVAHDFNNHLTVINGVAELLLRKFPAGDPLHRQIQDIRDAGELAVTLTRQLLIFSRQRKANPQPFSLNDIVRNNERVLRRLIREDIVLEIETDPDLGYARADPGQLDRVILNLVVNANDAISGPGKIRVGTHRFWGNHAGSAGDQAKSPREFVVLSVEDNGSGMDERTRRKIFEPFFTTKAEGCGTGLGLATVQAAVVQAGGWIDVTSQLGVGSVFSVYLPRVEATQELKRREAIPPSNQKTRTVLLVEDQEMVRKFASAVLAEQGYRVAEASTGVEALSIAADASLDISLLVTDVIMPEMSGDELARRLEESRPGLPTIFVSGYLFDQKVSTDQATRAFLQKPYTPEQLCDQVARLLVNLIADAQE
jgi:PAS domain S-box-containing protein